MRMKVLMFGWEFPPNSTGGLGTACYGLTKALSKLGVEITLVLPTTENIEVSFIKIKGANVKVRGIKSSLTPYISAGQYSREYRKNSLYGQTLFEEVKRYAEAAEEIAREEEFDLIHCHDWLTYEAGIRAKKISNKPLVAHIHATEFDRTGGLGANREVWAAEKKGMEAADCIMAVSAYTKNKVIEHYDINPSKIKVIHNAVERSEDWVNEDFGIKKNSKVVLFLGRITLQKGPDYFVNAAKKVVEHEPNVTFVMAGSGDMDRFVIEKSAEMGLAEKFVFTGFLKGDDLKRIYKMADVYVMPSVSEPFGITALEAIDNKTPIIISKNSGVSEIIGNCLRVDFWDVDQLTNKIVGVLRYNELADEMSQNAYQELSKISWQNTANKCIDAYEELMRTA